MDFSAEWWDRVKYFLWVKTRFGSIRKALHEYSESIIRKLDKPLHILLVAPEPFYEDRGTPIAIRQVLQALSESGWKIDLLTYPMGREIKLPGLLTIRIGKFIPIAHVPIGFSFRKILLDIVLTVKLWRLLKQNTYDCIHAVEEIAYPAAIIANRRNIPVICDMQSSIPEHMRKYFLCRTTVVHGILRLCEKWLIRNVDGVACSSGMVQLVREKAPSVPVHEWLFATDELDISQMDSKALRSELGISERSRVVLYCGNFESYQGVSMLAEAHPHVVCEVPDAVFLFVGANDATHEIQNQKDIIVLPRQPQSEIPRYLAMADVLVSPRENCQNIPLKVFEYMAAGKPIVATDSPSHRTVLDDDRAVLVEPSAHELAKGIVKILKNPCEAQRLGSAAQAYARQNFSWAEFKAALLKFYSHSINGRRIGDSHE